MEYNLFLLYSTTEGVGQLETIGDGYQHLNNKQFGRALMDYLQYSTEQARDYTFLFCD